jgi:O-antigen ligase
VPVALLAAAPFRIPVDLGSQHAFLLVPLYVVLAGASVALLYRAVRGGDLPPLSRWVALPAAAFVGWAALSLLWAFNVEQGAIELLFFAFPFVALLAVVARSPWVEWLPRALATTLVAVAAVLAAIGLYQAWSHTLVFAQDLRVANAYTTYFRVTSLFKDPSIYGRHLVLALSVLVVLLWLGRVRLAYAIALCAVVFGGLYFSYSQSSMLVLFVVVLGATVLLSDRRSRTIVAVAAVAVAVAGGAFAAVSARDTGLQRATAGRSRLVSVAGHVIANHPIVGVGIGSQPLAALRELKTRRRAEKNASHTTPLTVLAELGAIGFVLYLAFLAGSVKLLLETTRQRRVVGVGLAVGFAVLFLHSLFYSGFFQDPIMWGILGIASLAVWATADAAGEGAAPATSLFSRVESRWHT